MSITKEEYIRAKALVQKYELEEEDRYFSEMMEEEHRWDTREDLGDDEYDYSDDEYGMI